jgi:hypothetical protein
VKIDDSRHPGTRHFAPLFQYTHLPAGPMRTASENCTVLAEQMVDQLPDGPELIAGLRKLLEAKDCFVRAALGQLRPGVE